MGMVAVKEPAPRRRYPPWRQVRADLGLPELREFGGAAPVDKRDALTRSLVGRERGQHAVVVVERTADAVSMTGRIQPALERLVQRGQITKRQAMAGERIYKAWALGVCGAHDADAGGSTAYDPGGYRDAQLQAAGEYARIRDALGLRIFPVVFAVCCEDWSAQRWANERGGGMHKLGAVTLLRLGLDLAADHLGIG